MTDKGMFVDDPVVGARIVLVEFRFPGTLLFVAEDGKADFHRVKEFWWSILWQRVCWEAIGRDEGRGRWWHMHDLVGEFSVGTRPCISRVRVGRPCHVWEVGIVSNLSVEM